MAVKEIQNKVIFIRKLLPGGSEHSFGIHVAKMAGMPALSDRECHTLLHQLEKSHNSEELGKKDRGTQIRAESRCSTRQIQHPASGYQLSFIQLDDPTLLQIKEDILNTDINTLTPVEALMKLNEIKKLLGK